MSSRVYDRGDDPEVIPKWTIVEKFAKGRAVYIHPDLDPGQWLYKYMRADQAFRMLGDRQMWFAAPDTWDDPHESWWCEQLFRKGSHLETAYAYGSCWTRRWRDEPFWRMYACRCEGASASGAKPAKATATLPAVRFRAKAGTLLSWLREAARASTCKAYMGRVRYCPIDQLEEAAQALRGSVKSASPLAATGLHMKRRAYEFEDEVRMLWIDRLHRRKGHAIAFDPLAIFDQVMIGPTRSKDLPRYTEVESMLVALGIPPGLIVPSSVFTPPELL